MAKALYNSTSLGVMEDHTRLARAAASTATDQQVVQLPADNMCLEVQVAQAQVDSMVLEYPVDNMVLAV